MTAGGLLLVWGHLGPLQRNLGIRRHLPTAKPMFRHSHGHSSLSSDSMKPRVSAPSLQLLRQRDCCCHTASLGVVQLHRANLQQLVVSSISPWNYIRPASADLCWGLLMVGQKGYSSCPAQYPCSLDCVLTAPASVQRIA